jgi:hypothetical protein
MSQQSGPLVPYVQISPATRIRVERALPEPGEIVVRVGDRVEASQTIARTRRRGETHVLNVAQILGVTDADLAHMMVKKRGDRVEAGEVLAAKQGFLPFWHKPCRSPVSGRLVAIGFGWVVIEADSDARPGASLPESRAADEARLIAEMWNMPALIPGQVVDIRPGRGVTIETMGTQIIGACGLGGEGAGALRVAVDVPTDTLTADDIGMGFNNAVLLGGSNLSSEALKRAIEMKVRGIIVGSIGASVVDLMPDPPLPVVATEGYGHLSMSSHLFDVLRQLEGREVFLSGKMGRPWNDDRPTVAIPLTKDAAHESVVPADRPPVEPPRVGDRVRAVRRPLMGRTGQIGSFTAESRTVASGLSLTGAYVAFADSNQAESERAGAIQAQMPNDTPSASFIYTRDVEQARSVSQFVPWLNLERVG